MIKNYKWRVWTYYADDTVRITADDSGERSDTYFFDTRTEAEKFVMMYKLQHRIQDRDTACETDGYFHEINMVSPGKQALADYWWQEHSAQITENLRKKLQDK